MKTTRRSFMKMLLVGGAAAGSLLSLNAVTGNSLLNPTGPGNPKVPLTGDEVHVFDSQDIDNPVPNNPNMALGMVIDLNLCDGCQTDKVWHPALNKGNGGNEPRCTAAFRTKHNVAPEQECMKINYMQDNPMTTAY